jgi:hypothetical protein
LDKLAIILGFLFILSVVVAPVAFITWIWSGIELSKNIAMTASSIVALYIVVIYIKNN